MSKNWKVVREKSANGQAIVVIGVTSYTPIIVENELVMAAGQWMTAHNKRFNTSHIRFSKTQDGNATVIVIFGTWRVKCSRCKVRVESAARCTDCVRRDCDGVMSA